VIGGDAITVDTYNSYIRTDKTLIATLGVRNLVIVEAGDAVLIADRENVQEVRGLVEKLKALGRREHEVHARVHRPWGFFELIETGHRYQVKHLMVKPGASLSLQMHHQRAEHWVVVRGTARVTIDDRTMLLAENESTYIPIGAKHRLDNPGKVPLSLIEVQSGSYLGEDDIVRFDDRYGRRDTCGCQQVAFLSAAPGMLFGGCIQLLLGEEIGLRHPKGEPWTILVGGGLFECDCHLIMERDKLERGFALGLKRLAQDQLSSRPNVYTRIPYGTAGEPERPL